ncbi:MAG: hypothetical protein QOF92_3282 [Pseudonocardiales bacterium]|jgi:hypothetical protein|nr:hypothetical protein [Pseudonocardiales bacterium]
MADVQDDVREELLWDLRALDAADLITDERVAQAGVTSPVAGFYVSLHLNLGECYRKLGDVDRAREHLKLGRDSASALRDDGYGQGRRPSSPLGLAHPGPRSAVSAPSEHPQHGAAVPTSLLGQP